MSQRILMADLSRECFSLASPGFHPPLHAQDSRTKFPPKIVGKSSPISHFSIFSGHADVLLMGETRESTREKVRAKKKEGVHMDALKGLVGI